MKRVFSISIALLMFAAVASAQQVYTLEQCTALALQNNIKMRTAQIDINDAQMQEQEARSKYYPNVSANATYFHAADDLVQEKVGLSNEQQQNLSTQIQEVAPRLAELGIDPTFLSSIPTSYTFGFMQHGFMASVMALQPIYTGGRIVTGNKLARLQTEVKRMMQQQSEDQIRQTVEIYYNQLLSLYEKVKTIDTATKQLESIHRDATNAVDAGVGYKNDVLKVELKQNELAANRIKLENGIALSQLLLAQYIGLDGTSIDIDRTLPSSLPAPADYRVNHDTALDGRVESQLLDKNVEAQQLQTRMKRGELLPSVAVGAVAYYQNLSHVGNVNLAGMATVSIPISDWWSNRGVKRQQLAERRAVEERDDNRQLMLLQMQSAYDDLESAYRQLAIARQSIEQAEENLRLNHDYYTAGISTMSDLLDAQTQLRQSHDAHTDAVIAYLNARTAYLVATGRL